MTDRLELRRRRSQQVFYRGMNGIELGGGVWASLTPSLPERSLFNAVVYEDAGAVMDARGALAELYAGEGVRAWTVWVNPGDNELAQVLGRAGHHLDGTPEAMGVALDEADLDGPDVGEPGTWDDAIAVNEAAYGMAAGAMHGPPLAAVRLLAVPGKAVVGVVDADGDAWIGLVATHPDARGQGLSTGLMRQALRAARGRGCTTTTLEATAKGRPVYERLGYRSLGTVQMWERRVVTES